MVTIRALITYALIASVTHLGAMELSTEKNINTSTSAWDILTNEVITKIAACCDPVSRNILMKVSSTLNYLASKRNKDIILMHPLILGQWDRMHYMTVSCIKGKYHLLCNLLKNGANPNVIDYALGVTPLFIAEQNEYNTLANLLHTHGAIETLEVEKLKDINQSMPSAFIQAVYCNEIDTVKKYLSESTNPNDPIPSNNVTPLLIAASRGYSDIVKLLLERSDIRINVQENNRITALIHAAYKGHADIVQFLLAHPDIQVNVQNNNGCNALMLAAKRRSF